MAETWTERADKVLKLMETVTTGQTFKEGSAQKEFYQAVWSLCQKVKDLDSGDGQFVPSSSIMG
jgi:hypothetical protein